jgi:exosortase A-associated hydrolase 2
MHAEFIGESGGRIFALLRTPLASAGDCVLVVPPFAEEMNKCRKMVTDLAKLAGQDGRAVLCVDLYGTGDSEGEFSEARVGRWIDDLADAVKWSAGKGWPVTSVVGIRLGAILAARLVREHELPHLRAVFWQPVINGSRFIDQFLRIRVLASRMERDSKETVADLRTRLTAGETIEVAGYGLSPALCADIDSLDLKTELIPAISPIRWLEVVADASAPVTPATQRAIEQTRAAGCAVEHRRFVGEPFWMATEIVRNAELVAAS